MPSGFVLPKVAVITPFYPRRGAVYAGSFVKSQVEGVARLGAIQQEVFTYRPLLPPWAFLRIGKHRSVVGAGGEYLAGAVPVSAMPLLVLPRNLNLAGLGRKMAKELLKNPFVRAASVIHGHGTVPAGLAAVLVGAELGKPVVLSVHGTDVEVYAQLHGILGDSARKTLRRATRVLAASDHLKSVVAQCVAGARVRRHYIGIDTSWWTPADEPGDPRAFDTPVRLLFVGNLLPAKGVDLLIQTVWADPRVELTIVGSGPLGRWLSDLQRESKLPPHIRWVGPLDRAGVRAQMRASDALVLPSLREGLGMVLLEAAACGLPAIASNVGGIPEAIVEGHTGYLFAAGELGQLRRAIGVAVDRRSELHQMGMAAREHVAKLFDIAAQSKNLEATYRELVACA